LFQFFVNAFISGERIAIQGFDPSKGSNLSNFQFQVKPQTLQFQVDPSKLTVLQELPEVGKVKKHKIIILGVGRSTN
jgi:hypothetical protein